MKSCPVCARTNLADVFTRRRVPALQNVFPATARAARRFPTGDIELVACLACGFLFNRRFEAHLAGYGQGYENTQFHSPAFQRYIGGLIDTLVQSRGVTRARIVEIGCGNGRLMRDLVGDASLGNRGWGFDPAYTGPATACSGRARFEARLFGVAEERIRADVVKIGRAHV